MPVNLFINRHLKCIVFWNCSKLAITKMFCD